MAKFFRQSSWLGIEFCDLNIRLHQDKLAGPEFYDAFYEKLFQTYPNYSNLSLDWRIRKENDAAFLSRFIPKSSNLLSYGCGIGYLESCLMDILGQTFYVSDFSPYILKYRPDLEQNFLSLENFDDLSFSHILLNQVTYALNDSELHLLIEKLHGRLKSGGVLIVSYTPYGFSFKGFIRSILVGFFSLKYFYRLGLKFPNLITASHPVSEQGWGYHRSKKQMIGICTAIDFKVLSFYRFQSNHFLFLEK